MITQVCALFDKKALAFKTPFFVTRLEMATRALSQAVNKPSQGQENSEVATFPEDFALYHLGTFNDETAQMTLHNQPIIVVEALSFKKAV